MKRSLFARLPAAAPALLLAGVALPVAALAADESWSLYATASDSIASNGVPVAALEQPGWALRQPPASGTTHAWRAIRAEAGATHPSGWSLGALARAEATLSLSPDAAYLYAQDQLGDLPTTPRTYAVSGQLQGWRGQGLTVATPWWPTGQSGWQWSAQADLMRLDRLRAGSIQGTGGYNASGGYDLDVRTDRNDSRIQGRFLGPSDSAGVGASLSLAVLGKPSEDLRVRLDARDLLSRLHWGALASETTVINTNVSSRNPDGSLDYGPALTGVQQQRTVNRRIGAQWAAALAWRTDLVPLLSRGAWTAEASRKAELNQVWLGWQSELDFVDLPWSRRRLLWRVRVEPNVGAVGAEVRYGGFFARLATDRTDHYAQLRQWQVGWRMALGN